MTCVKQEFCIHEKYCQRHIGQNFDSCILFSRNSKPMTNEEYLKSCDTEQFAEWISKATIDAWFRQVNNELPKPNGAKEWEEWLKQPHTFE